jgi:hypothetical protein
VFSERKLKQVRTDASGCDGGGQDVRVEAGVALGALPALVGPSALARMQDSREGSSSAWRLETEDLVQALDDARDLRLRCPGDALSDPLSRKGADLADLDP